MIYAFPTSGSTATRQKAAREPRVEVSWEVAALNVICVLPTILSLAKESRVQLKCDLPNRVKVFISSSMAAQSFLEQRSALISFFERIPLFSHFAIESSASPDNVVDRYLEKVKWADIVIVILQQDLRPGVVKEFYKAVENQKRVFAYVSSQSKSPDLETFIRDEVRSKVTTTDFSDTVQLIDKIEKDLLDDLLTKYVNLYEENISLKREIDLLSKPHGLSSLFGSFRRGL